MEKKTDLSYYEYWLSKEDWAVPDAIKFVSDYVMLVRSWEQEEDYLSTKRAIEGKIKNALAGNPELLSTRKTLTGWKDGAYVEDELVLDECRVSIKIFLQWLHQSGHRLPYDFLTYIGVEENIPRVTDKMQDRLDKVTCQGIARTLWDIHPDMTIEEMQFQQPLQIYGSGKLYSGTDTLRRWLSEVDPRQKKRGPKKKDT